MSPQTLALVLPPTRNRPPHSASATRLPNLMNFPRRFSLFAFAGLALVLAPLASGSDALIDEKTAPSADPSRPVEPGKVIVPEADQAKQDAEKKTPPAADKADEKRSTRTEPATPRDPAEKSDPAPKKPVSRSPLKLQVDSRQINREAPDRVSYAPVIRKTAASVVYVYSNKKVQGPDLTPFLNDPNFRRFFEIPGHRNVPRGGGPRGGRLPDRQERGLGSGVIISADGYILTNNHVVEGADDVTVSIGESPKKYEATVVGRDSATDIAVLKIEPKGALVPATLGNSDQLQVGDVVLAIGNPFGIGQSVSRGIVSALGRGQLGIEQLEDFIQTDAAINPGNSGGALIDSDGRVVGINTAILSATGSFNGVGLAIPINLVRFAAEQIVSKGRVDRGFLGVSTQDLTEEIGAQFNAEKGALINEVTVDSPADKAGLKAGDVILKINDTEIRHPSHLQLVVTQFMPDTEVTVTYLRDGKTGTVKAKLGLRPNRGPGGGDDDNPAEKSDEGVLNGVTVGDITPEVRDELQIPARIKGAVVQSIEPDSPSAQQGLREGDVIMELNRRPTPDADTAVKLSEEIKGPKVMVLIWRAGGTRFIVIDEAKGKGKGK